MYVSQTQLLQIVQCQRIQCSLAHWHREGNLLLATPETR